MDDDQERIDRIRTFAENKSVSFDLDFIDSIEDWLADRGELTDAQSDALDNIIARFHIK